MEMSVYVTTQFEGFHRWKDAPDEVAFLRQVHRHMFHVKVGWSVTDENRELEFIQQRRLVNIAIGDIKLTSDKLILEWSCEQWAVTLLRHLGAEMVEVSEDGENGAVVWR